MALIDIPQDFLSNTFIFQNFIPFIVLFAIFWGLLEAIDRFRSKTNLVISLGFALIAAFTNPWILSYIATLGSYAALIMFGLLFLFGVVRWGLGRGRDIYLETSSYSRQRQHLEKRLFKINQELASSGLDPSKAEHLLKEKKDLENKIDLLRVKERAVT